MADVPDEREWLMSAKDEAWRIRASLGWQRNHNKVMAEIWADKDARAAKRQQEIAHEGQKQQRTRVV